MPPSRTHAFSSDELFHHSACSTDIRYIHSLLANRHGLQENYLCFIFTRQLLRRQTEEYRRRRQFDREEIKTIEEFAEATFNQG